MRRLDFVALAGGMPGLLPLTAHAQQAMPVVGFSRSVGTACGHQLSVKRWLELTVSCFGDFFWALRYADLGLGPPAQSHWLYMQLKIW